MNNSKLNWKIFWMAFFPIFIIVSLHLLGIQMFAGSFLSPLAQKGPTLQEIIRGKVHKNPNYYSLHDNSSSPFSVVAQTYAATPAVDADTASSYTVIDFENGDIIQEKQADQRLPIASLTKIMSSVVALDLAKPTDIFTVTPEAARVIPTKIGVTPGEKMTLEELLNAALLTSANDAVEVIRDNIDARYGKGAFIIAMNEKAQYLNLRNSHFANPQGFDNPGNYSSSHDLAILSYYALKNYPLIAQLAAKDYQYIAANGTHKKYELPNWNGLLDVYPNIEGVKIGNTDDAGKTTVVLSTRENKTILAVLLGAPGVLERDLWASQLLDLGFNKTIGLPAVGVTEAQLRKKYQTWNFWYQ